MDALSRLLTLNAPQGSIDKNCPLGGDWQLPHAAGELSVIRWHTVTQGEAQLEMPTGDAMTLTPGKVVILPQTPPTVCASLAKHRHISCAVVYVCTRRHVISLPRCRKCYVLPRRRIAPPVSGLTPPFCCYSRSQNAIYLALMSYTVSSAPRCLPSPFATGYRRLAQRKACSIYCCIPGWAA